MLRCACDNRVRDILLRSVAVVLSLRLACRVDVVLLLADPGGTSLAKVVAYMAKQAPHR